MYCTTLLTKAGVPPPLLRPHPAEVDVDKPFAFFGQVKEGVSGRGRVTMANPIWNCRTVMSGPTNPATFADPALLLPGPARGRVSP